MTPECADIRILLSRRLDRDAIDHADSDHLDAHLARCADCRAIARDLDWQERALHNHWSADAVMVPPGFAARTVAALPPRALPRLYRRRAVLAAALALLFLTAALVGGAQASAGFDLLLRRVGLREEAPPPRVTVMQPRELTLDEARASVPWSIRTPLPPPAGYRLDRVAVGEVYRFADGAAVFLFYTRAGTTVPQLVITQFRVVDKEAVIAPIAPGAGRRVAIGERSGLFIEGMWVERGGQQAWERGTLVRLIVEDGDQIVQFEGDPAAGWDEATLVALAARLR